MDQLFDVYVEQEPARALALAEELAKLDPKDKNWAAKAALQQNVLKARTLIGERKFAEAVTLLESTTAPRYTNAKALHLTKAEAYDLGGETAKAFDSLAKVITLEPTDALLKALNAYGAKLGKTAVQIESELWRLRDEQAKAFKEFALAKYTGTASTASLADYRGKVVLVDFWYPTCGPCRGEFPNLQKALDKYGPQGFVVLAINVEPPEDDMVLPYLKHNRYGFIPLKSNWDWARENYGVRGAPTNFPD
jgi:thiol-disulfide isomerase/thioredoxin